MSRRKLTAHAERTTQETLLGTYATQIGGPRIAYVMLCESMHGTTPEYVLVARFSKGWENAAWVARQVAKRCNAGEKLEDAIAAMQATHGSKARKEKPLTDKEIMTLLDTEHRGLAHLALTDPRKLGLLAQGARRHARREIRELLRGGKS